MRLIDLDDLTERAMWYEAHGLTLPIVHELISSQDTVDAIPISFIEKRIEQLKNHADYEFESNGGYAGGSQYRQWELECLLDAWAKRREE